jgi:RNA polymerase sigma factor (sigma-70 family)
VDTTAAAQRQPSSTDDLLVQRAARGDNACLDAELVVRAQRGDAAAFALVVERIAARSLVIARRILGDPDLAQDATQRALVRIWQGLPKLRDVERFESWSYRVLLRACYAEGRKHRDWASKLPLLATGEAQTDDDVGTIVDRDQLERGLRRLSSDHRTVVVLRFFLDLPLDRVAEVLEIPVGTARSRLHHAIRALRATLDADLRPAA